MNKNSFKINPALLFINGEWKPSAAGKTFQLINPADETVITTIAQCEPADVEEAVRSAKHAFEYGPWPTMPPSERAKLLFAIADLIQANAEELAFCETVEMRMLFRDSLNINVPHIINMFRYYGGWATKLEGAHKPGQGWLREHLFCYTRT